MLLQEGVTTHTGFAKRFQEMFTSGNYSVTNMFRMRENTYPRDRPPPQVPTGPADKVAGNAYYSRDVRRQPRHVTIVENGVAVARLGNPGDGSLAEKLAAAGDLPPTPGHVNQFALQMDKTKRQSYWQRLHTIQTAAQTSGEEKQKLGEGVVG